MTEMVIQEMMQQQSIINLQYVSMYYHIPCKFSHCKLAWYYIINRRKHEVITSMAVDMVDMEEMKEMVVIQILTND